MRWVGFLMIVFIFSGCWIKTLLPTAKDTNEYNKWYNENKIKQQDKENKKYEKPDTSFHEDL